MCLLYAFRFSFQTTPLLARVFCGVQRDTSCNRAGRSSFLSHISFLCAVHGFPVFGFSACTFSGDSSPALGRGNWGVVCNGNCASSLPLPCRDVTRAQIQHTGFICHCVIRPWFPLRAGRMHSYFSRKHKSNHDAKMAAKEVRKWRHQWNWFQWLDLRVSCLMWGCFQQEVLHYSPSYDCKWRY